MAVLPRRLLDALGRTMGEWEACGAWPAQLRNILFSMIPKPTAETGGRPPSRLLLYIPGVHGHM